MVDPDKNLITSKFDIDRAERLIAMGPSVAPYIPHMMEWIKDMNWPVANRLFPFLASLGAAVVPEIQRVLSGDDLIWKYWCITLIGELPSESAEFFRTELERLVNMATDLEKREELDEVAVAALAKLNARAVDK